MFSVEIDPKLPPAEFYNELNLLASGLLSSESDPIAGMANLSSLLFHTLPTINWAGFYLVKGDQLVLGPFHGQPACTRIPVGRGVCGTAVADNCVQLVEDVDSFPGHIACDAASKSEIVLPVCYQGRVVAVLDIDSPVKSRFDNSDKEGLMKLVGEIETCLSFDEL